MRRTRKDVHRAIDALLSDPEWSTWSDRAIADAVGCSPTTVGRRRHALPGPVVRTGRDGRATNTAGIGGGAAPRSRRSVAELEADNARLRDLVSLLLGAEAEATGADLNDALNVGPIAPSVERAAEVRVLAARRSR